jgi:hypothetical protein
MQRTALTLRAWGEKASRERQGANLGHSARPKRAPRSAQRRPCRANVIDEKHSLGPANSVCNEGPVHVSRSLMVRQGDLTARVTSSAKTPQEQRCIERLRNGLRQKRSLIIPALATTTPVEGHGNHGVDLATPLSRDSSHEGTENHAELAVAPVLEPMDRVGDRPAVLKDCAGRPSGLDEGLACFTEDSIARLITANAAQGRQQVEQTFQHPAHPAISATA